ncbi:hypothetical protein D1872_51370 [compost metagenome]
MNNVVKLTQVVMDVYEDFFVTGLKLGNAGFTHVLEISGGLYKVTSDDIQADMTNEMYLALDRLIADDGEDHPYIDWDNSSITDPNTGLTIQYTPSYKLI